MTTNTTPRPSSASARATRSHDVRSLLALACGVVALAIASGLVYGFTATQWLTFAMATAVVLWVGGAVSGQVIIGRLLDAGTREQLVDFTRVLLLVIPAFFVPCGFIAFGCGMALVALHGLPFLSATVLIPTALFVLTSIMGAAVSAPGYTRLLRFAAANGADHPGVIRRLMPLAWLNRIELTLVIGLGFTTVVSALH